MKKYQGGFASGMGEDMAKAFVIVMIFVFALGAALTLAVIYGIPYAWDWIKPWLHSVTS